MALSPPPPPYTHTLPAPTPSTYTFNSTQELLKPYLLRRVKANVLKALPPKTETVIDVELTFVQKKYYRY
jgi:SNF2 family DNA or RNA helicase